MLHESNYQLNPNSFPQGLLKCLIVLAFYDIPSVIHIKFLKGELQS